MITGAGAHTRARCSDVGFTPVPRAARPHVLADLEEVTTKLDNGMFGLVGAPRVVDVQLGNTDTGSAALLVEVESAAPPKRGWRCGVAVMIEELVRWYTTVRAHDPQSMVQIMGLPDTEIFFWCPKNVGGAGSGVPAYRARA